MVEAQGLTVAYPGGGGIRNLSLSVPAGGTCSIIGPSGCGKTTLLHCLAGLIEPDGGRFEVGAGGTGSTGGTGARGARTRVGLVQQTDALFPWLTVGQNVDLGLRHRFRRRHTRAARSPDTHVEHLITSLGLQDLRRSYPGQLSGGERQRASLARTLASQPDVLLLDEPSSALDAFTREALQDLLLHLHREYRFTIISVTHHIEEALFLAERVLVMGRGTFVAAVTNPRYPDPQARSNSAFYELAVELRARLAEVMPRA